LAPSAGRAKALILPTPGLTPNYSVTYRDLGLTPNTACQYRVQACNAAGVSAYSNVLSVTTRP
jgi:hypothetical protein